MRKHRLTIECNAPNKYSPEQIKEAIEACIEAGMADAQSTLDLHFDQEEWIVDPRPAVSIRNLEVKIADG